MSDLGGLYLDGEEIESVELEESCSLTLKNYSFEFIKEEKSSASQSVTLPHLEAEKETSFTEGEGTKVLSDSDFIYSLYVYIEGEMSDHIHLNQGESWVVGRSEECDISIDYSILTRKHLKITKKEKSFYVEDLGSSNKTYLNKKELEPHKVVLLKPNDEISVSDLKMIFEVRHRNFDQMMDKLPASVSEDSNETENLPEIVAPKVVLEDVQPENEDSSLKPKNFLKSKKKLFLIAFVALALIFYFWFESKKKKPELPDPKPVNELEILYEEILDKNLKKMFQLCLNQLEELHNKAGGNFKDSQRIFTECKFGLEFQKRNEEREKLEEEQAKTKAKIQKIVEECQKQYEEKKIQTEEELNQCAEALRGLSVGGEPQLEKIRQEIMGKQIDEDIEKEKREKYQNRIRRVKALYKKAQAIDAQKQALKAVKAYNVFLKSAKRITSLQGLYKKAELARDEIQNKYNTERDRLYSSCESLIGKNKMKEAYVDCQKILDFKKDDKKAKESMELAKRTLQKELKPVYEQSVLDESFSRIDEAKKLWEEILEKDIKEGYYYRKASFQLKKYR